MTFCFPALERFCFSAKCGWEEVGFVESELLGQVKLNEWARVWMELKEGKDGSSFASLAAVGWRDGVSRAREVREGGVRARNKG